MHGQVDGESALSLSADDIPTLKDTNVSVPVSRSFGVSLMIMTSSVPSCSLTNVSTSDSDTEGAIRVRYNQNLGGAGGTVKIG